MERTEQSEIAAVIEGPGLRYERRRDADYAAAFGRCPSQWPAEAFEAGSEPPFSAETVAAA